MQVRDLMNPSVVSITPSESASLAARLLSRHNVGSLPVCGEDGGLRGIVTDRDIILRCVAAEEEPPQDPGEGHHDPQLRGGVPRRRRQGGHPAHGGQAGAPPPRAGGGQGGGDGLPGGTLAQCRQFDMEASKALCEISDQVKHGYVE